MIDCQRLGAFLAASIVVALLGATVARVMNTTALNARSTSPQVLYLYDLYGDAGSRTQYEFKQARQKIANGRLEHIVYYGGLLASDDAKILAEIEVAIYKKLGVEARAVPEGCIVFAPTFYEQEMKKAVEAKLGVGFEERVAHQAEQRLHMRKQSTR